MWFPRKIIVSTEIFFKTGKFPSSFVGITYCSFIIQIIMKDHCLVPTVHPNNGRKTRFFAFALRKIGYSWWLTEKGGLKKLGQGVHQIALHINTKGASNWNRIVTILCLFARFHSRERLLRRRTAAMCSFVISNKISTSLSSNIYRSLQSI